jgi:chemotaxis protein CheC
MASVHYTDQQLDALRELANIGSGTAATALSSLLGRQVDISVPTVAALDVADAVDAAGDPEDIVWAIAVPVDADLDALALLLVPDAGAAALCGMLGVDPADETGRSALGEVGNILVASYVGALAAMAGFVLDLRPPEIARDMLAAIVASVLAVRSDTVDVAILLDSELDVEGEACGLSFMLLPTPEGVADLLNRIGLGG